MNLWNLKRITVQYALMMTTMKTTRWRWQQQQQQLFYGPLSRTTRVSQNQKKRSSTHTYLDHQPSFISSLHLLRFINYLYAWQSFSTTSFQVQGLIGLPLDLEPSTSYSIHFFNDDCLLFAPHAHTIATCFAVVPRLCHLCLVSLWILYLELFYLNVTHPSDHFSFLPTKVPPHFVSLQARSHFHAT